MKILDYLAGALDGAKILHEEMGKVVDLFPELDGNLEDLARHPDRERMLTALLGATELDGTAQALLGMELLDYLDSLELTEDVTDDAPTVDDLLMDFCIGPDAPWINTSQHRHARLLQAQPVFTGPPGKLLGNPRRLELIEQWIKQVPREPSPTAAQFLTDPGTLAEVILSELEQRYDADYHDPTAESDSLSPVPSVIVGMALARELGNTLARYDAPPAAHAAAMGLLFRWSPYNGVMWPPREEMARILGCSVSKIKRGLAWLLDHKFIFKVPHPSPLPGNKYRPTAYRWTRKAPPRAHEHD